MTKHLPEDVRRQQILNAARRCFVDKGYFPTRIDDIASLAGLSKGGIYFHFGSKKEIFEALVQQEYEESAAFLQEISSSNKKYDQLFMDMAQHYLESFGKKPDHTRFFMVMGEMAGRDESIRKLLGDLQNQYAQVVAKIIQDGIDSGALKPVDPKSAATVLKGIIDALEGYTALGVDMDLDKLLATGLEMILGGLVIKDPGKS